MREELIQRSAALNSLSKHPDYPELQLESQRKIARMTTRLVADMLAGKPVDQREIDYARGWLDALHWAVELPGKAEDTLERALREAEKRKRGNP